MPKLLSEHGFSADLCLPVNKIRLMCDAPDLQPDPAKMQQVIELAEKELGEPIPLCPASLYRRFSTDGNRSEYEAPYFRRRDMALRLSLAEACEKKGRFTEKLADVVWAIMEESSWSLPAHLAQCSPSHGDLGLPAVFNESRFHAVDLFAAATAAMLSAVYYFNKDALCAFSPAVTEKLQYTVKNRLFTPFLHCDFWWTGLQGNTVNNWNPWIVSNILFAAAVLADSNDLLRQLVCKVAKCIDCYTASLPEDGGCDEGPNYWTVAGASYFDSLELFYDITGGRFDIFGDPFVKAMCEYEPKMHISGDYFLNFADCPPRVHPDGPLLVRMGEKCGSETLRSFGEAVSLHGGVRLAADCVYRTLRGLTVQRPAQVKATGSKRTWQPKLKVMTARESEETDAGFFVAMKGGHNNESHNHNDIGSVVVYRNGRPVLIDTGRGTYCRQTFSDRRYELWYTRSGYHNVPDIGGAEQLPGEAYRSCDEVYDALTGGVTMQLKHAYPLQAGVISYTRETVLCGGNVRITDDFTLENEREVDIHFITCREPELCENGAVRLAEGAVLRADPRLAVNIETFPVNDKTIEHAWETPVLWRIHLRAKTEKGRFVTVIE